MMHIDGTSDQAEPTGSVVGTVARLGAAAAVFISGLVHLQLYFDGYRDFPDANLGRSFVLNAVASVVVAVLLVLRRDVVVRAAAAAVLVGTLIAFAISRTDRGVFGFTERGLEPSPQAVLALVMEVLGLVLLAATFVPAVGPGWALPPATRVTAAAGLAIVAVVAGALWAREESPTVAEAPASTAVVATDPTTPATTVVTGSSAPAATTTSPTPGSVAIPATAPPAPDTSGPSADVVTVSIADFAFVEQTIEIPVDTTIEWVNNDSFAHSVVADDDSFRSEDLATGERFSFTFDTPGEFPYICGIHPSMIGSIVVTA